MEKPTELWNFFIFVEYVCGLSARRCVVVAGSRSKDERATSDKFLSELLLAGDTAVSFSAQ